MRIREKLGMIQNEMDVPKSLFNSYGKYWYRNAETILSVAKPVCKKYKCTVYTTEEPVVIGERYYVKSTAHLVDWESDDVIDVSAYAREPEEKKGMDESQISGTASSYAKKYALNDMFDLDDIKDADSDEHTNETNNKAKKPETKEQPKAKEYNPEADDGEPATARQMEVLNKLTDEQKLNIINHFGLEKIEEISKEQAKEVIRKLTKK